MAKILVVDDDPDILKIAERVLANAEHEVYVAPDAIKAMDFLDKSDFDALISDANMPHFSGFELIQTLRNQKKHRHMAIAMLTGLRERKDIEKAMKAGVDDYIVKPIDPLIFLRKVEDLFVKKPAMKRPEVHFPTTSTESSGRMAVKIQVTQISEMGVTLRMNFNVPAGSIIDLDSEIFDRIGANPPPLKISSGRLLDDGLWESRAIFLGANEAFLQKVRAYVLFPNKNRGAA